MNMVSTVYKSSIKILMFFSLVIFYDLESILPKTTNKDNDTISTDVISSHIPIIWSFIVIDMIGSIIHEEAGYCEENAAEKFLERLLNIEKKLMKNIKRDVSMRYFIFISIISFVFRLESRNTRMSTTISNYVIIVSYHLLITR